MVRVGEDANLVACDGAKSARSESVASSDDACE